MYFDLCNEIIYFFFYILVLLTNTIMPKGGRRRKGKGFFDGILKTVGGIAPAVIADIATKALTKSAGLGKKKRRRHRKAGKGILSSILGSVGFGHGGRGHVTDETTKVLII